MQAPQPPTSAAEFVQPASANPPVLVTVSQQTDNVIVASSDRPMFLMKAGHTEQATLSYVLYIATKKTVLRLSTSPGPDQMRWSYTSYIQRSLCFTSITGLFACSAAETIPLDEKSEGEAPLTSASPAPPPAIPPPSASPALGPPPTPSERPTEASPAEMALSKLSVALRQQATAVFDEDKRLKVDALLKAAGVRVLPPSPIATPKKRR